MTKPELRSAAKADLVRQLETAPSEPLFPQEMKEPRGVPDWLHKTGLYDFVAVQNKL